jgi:GNAT superfamily N-acetyltransferase
MAYQILGYGYTWWSGDPLPQLSSEAGLRIVPTDDVALLAELARLDRDEVSRRIQQSHQPYLALLDRQPVAYGWSATKTGAVDELNLLFTIPPGNRYLWDFATLPQWRGRGVYPRLLQAILQQEQPVAERFWIGHTADNHASRRGILHAGFQLVEAMALSSAGALTILPIGASGRAMHSPMGLKLGVLAVEAGS